MSWTKFQVGRLLCGKVRDYLQEERIKGREIQWHESSGWFARTFTISGNDRDVTHVGRTLMDWFKRLDALERKA